MTTTEIYFSAHPGSCAGVAYIQRCHKNPAAPKPARPEKLCELCGAVLDGRQTKLCAACSAAAKKPQLKTCLRCGVLFRGQSKACRACRWDEMDEKRRARAAARKRTDA